MTYQKFSGSLTLVAVLTIAMLGELIAPAVSSGQQTLAASDAGSPISTGSDNSKPVAQPPQKSLAPAPSTGFRPIGGSSRVDQYKPRRIIAGRPQSEAFPEDLTPIPSAESSVTLLGVSQATNTQELPGTASVAPTAFAQDGFVIPNSGVSGDVAAPVTGQAAPPVTRPSAGPATTPRQPVPAPNRDPASLTRGASPTATPMPQNSMTQPGLAQNLPPSPSDLTPVPTPQMNSQWSNAANSPLVTGPSGYRAVFWDCSTPNVMQTSGPYVYAPPTVMPNNPQALALTTNYPGYRPIFTLGQENYNVQLGQGIVGQPTVYVPGQPVRNFFRYLFP